MNEKYTTKQAAEYIGHSPGTLQNWRVLGGGPAFIKPRMKVFYLKADLDTWMMGAGTSVTTAQARFKGGIK